MLVLLPSGTKSVDLQVPSARASTKEVKIECELPEHFKCIETITKAMHPSTRSYDPRTLGSLNALSGCRANVTILPKKECAACIPIGVQMATQTWSKSSARVTTGACTSMQVALIDFSAVQENYTLSFSMTTIALIGN